MEETKILNGSMNLDDSPESLGANEYFKAYNYRSSGTNAQEANRGSNLESTRTITPNGQRPSGFSTSVGVGKFNNVKKAYTVYYNTDGKHQITEFDYDTLVETVIFEDLTDTAGDSVFNITAKTFFNDIKLLHKKYLLMTDGESGMIYSINIERLKAGGYGVITKEAFNLLKGQPLKPIKAVYTNDSFKKANLLKGKLFQFRPRYGYADYAKSLWGTISQRPVPELEMTDTVGDNPSKNNGIVLKVNMGNALVEEVDVAVREGLLNWRLIKTITRAYVLTLADQEIDIDNEIVEAYNPTTNEYTFIFYNEGSGEAIDVLETDEPYDAVPKNAGTLEIVNGDIIALGDIEEGYERPIVDLKVSVSTYLPDVATSVSVPRTFTSESNQIRVGGSHSRAVGISFIGTPKAGDRIIISLGNIDNTAITAQVDYTLVASDDEDMNNFIEHLFNIVPSRYPSFGVSIPKSRRVDDATHGSILFITESRIELKNVQILLNQLGTVEGKTLNTVKSNTSYQLGVEYFDKYGTYMPIVSGSKQSITTPSYAVSQGLIPQIGWNLSGTPPADAASYQIIISENSKYLKNLYITGAYDAEESKDDFIAINMASLAKYATAKEGAVVQWDFATGDRVSLIHTFVGNTTPVKWFNSPPLDFAIQDIEIKTVTAGSVTTTKYLLKIKKSVLLPTTDITGKEILMELYTLKQSDTDLESKIFFEIGEQFDVINGQHSVTSGTVKKADSYVRPRKFVSNLNPNTIYALTVEDFNFSDGWQSRFWSAGRGRTYKDEVGYVRRSASIRYSDTFALGTQVNNSNRFYSSSIYGESPDETSSVHGAITKLVMRNTYLIALQELQIGHIPVFRATIETADSQQSITISNKLFNKVTYVSSFGTGGAKKAITISDKNVVYFVDINKGYPCRDGYDGVKDIPNKLVKHFSEKIKGLNADSLISYYDDFYQEWNLTFPDLSSGLKTFTFDTSTYEYKDAFTNTIDTVTIVQPEHGTVTVVEGDLQYLPDTDYVGEDSFSIVFTAGGQTITKIKCGEVIAGNDVVDDYSFNDALGQNLNEEVISNQVIAGGITIPIVATIDSEPVGGEAGTVLPSNIGMRRNGGTWTTAPLTVQPNDIVEVKQTTPNSYGTSAAIRLYMGSKSAKFTVKTKYGNAGFTSSFQRQCDDGATGSMVEFEASPNTYFGETQELADLAAQEAGQAFANDPDNGGTCTTTEV